MRELIQVFASKFVNHTGAYYQQWVNDTQYGYTAVYQAPTLDIIDSHLKGDITLALPALDESNNGRWLCFDDDKQDDNLDKLETFLHQWGWHCIREGARPGRSGHLWIFFDKPITGNSLVILGNTMIRLSGVSSGVLEIFPKQSKANKLAGGVRTPLGRHLKPTAGGVRGWFDIPERDIQSQLAWLAQQKVNDSEVAVKLATEYQPVTLPPVRNKYKNGNNGGYERINIFDYVQVRRCGSQLVAQCPLCSNEAHDRHQDNLHISPDGQKFCCWYGGQPGKIHTARDIVKALRQGAA